MTWLDAIWSWGGFSGLALVMLGATAVLRPRTRVPGGAPFAAFAMLWGVQILVIQVATYGDVASPHRLFLLALSLLLVLPLLLLQFLRSFLGERLSPRSVRPVVAVHAVIGLVTVALMFADVRMLLAGVDVTDSAVFPRWGPAMPILVSLPLFFSMTYALIAMARAHRAAPTPRLVVRIGLIMVGLSLYLGHNAASNLVFFAALMAQDGGPMPTLYVLIFATIVVTLFALGMSAWRGSWAGRTRVERGAARATAAGLILPIGAGFLEGVLVVSAYPTLNLIGVSRLIGVGLLAFGLEIWRFDGRNPVMRGIATKRGGIVGALATGLVASGVMGLVSTGLLVPLAAGTAGAALAYAPADALSKRMFRTAPAERLPDRRYDERIETYRAALEMSLARESLDRDARFLASLRERLQISLDEDRLLRHLAEKTVVPIRRHGAGAAYERLRLLGEGGNGRTWLARDRRRDSLVVLKEPLERWQTEPATVERLIREARLAAKVRNRHVVRVHEVVEDGPVPVIVMDYLPGGTLTELLHEDGVLHWEQARTVVLGVLSGLAAVHAAGIVHRDVKPSNVLFDADGEPHVADFGIAIQSGSGGTVLLHGEPVGTRGYIAPEVASGQTLGDVRADLYACGVLLHHCLYGAPPDRHTVHYLAADIPPGLRTLIDRATRADPSERYPDAATFAHDLQRVRP